VNRDFILLLLAATAAVAGARVFRAMLRRRSVSLVDASVDTEAPDILGDEPAGASRVARWLSLAGYRRPSAASSFIAAQVGAIIAAALLALLLNRVGAVEWMVRWLGNIPGGVGETFQAIAILAPWIVFLIVAFVPILVVRAARRDRVRQVEKDLPLALDLFATLAEAGLGFDSALARIQESQPARRALTMEFAAFQREMLAGVPRLQALRQLAQRIDVTTMTAFTSALIQAEQIGASLAETLRHQAEDMRDRRRMRALLLAQALPVKLVFPLIICFLPGIFVSTLGPALHQMIKVADSVLRNVR